LRINGVGAEANANAFSPACDVEARILRLIKTGHRKAVVRIGDVEAILTEAAVAFVAPFQFKACDIDPLAYKIVVVKEGYLFPGLTRIAPRYIMLFTPGSGDMRIERLAYLHRRKPVYPFEPDASFDPEKVCPGPAIRS